MFSKRILGLTAFAGLAAGCAAVPTVTASYYFPKADTQISITQSLACNSDSTRVVAAAAVSSNTTYSSDNAPDSDGKIRQGRLRYTDLNGPLSDADTSLTFTDDGRLAGVNTSSTGQGDTIIKNAISLASAVAPGVALRRLVDFSKVCDVIKNYSAPKSQQGQQQPGPPPPSQQPSALTLTYALDFLYDEQRNGRIYIKPNPVVDSSQQCQPLSPSPTLTICPDANSLPAFNALKQELGKLNIAMNAYSVSITPNARRLDQIYYAAAAKMDENELANMVALDLNRVAMADLVVRGTAGDITLTQDVWRSEYPIPLKEIYQLPIPRAVAFGKQQFTLTLSSYGSVTKLEYGKTSGTPDVVDSAGALAKALQAPTPATQAAALQGQSDLIYQTQRLAICRANPQSCPGK